MAIVLVTVPPGFRQHSVTPAVGLLEQQVEELEGPLPVLGLRVRHLGVNDLERSRQRLADPTHDGDHSRLGLLAQRDVHGRVRGEPLKYRLELDVGIELAEPGGCLNRREGPLFGVLDLTIALVR